MSPTERHQYREVVAAVAQKARAILPAQVNGRIEKAIALVLHGDVEPQADGSVTVFSATDATRRYILQGSSCTCADYERRQAPDGWCSHRIAAGIHKRCQQEMSAQSTTVLSEPEEAVVLPDAFEPYPDNDSEGDLEPLPPAPAPAPLPEARSSVNVHVTIAGRDCQLTLRDHDEHSLLARLEAVFARYPLLAPPQAPSQPPASAEPEPEKRYCPRHGTAMQLNQKEGRQWHSHRTADGAWCKGK
jgi:hypothetical protein